MDKDVTMSNVSIDIIPKLSREQFKQLLDVNIKQLDDSGHQPDLNDTFKEMVVTLDATDDNEFSNLKQQYYDIVSKL